MAMSRICCDCSSLHHFSPRLIAIFRDFSSENCAAAAHESQNAEMSEPGRINGDVISGPAHQPAAPPWTVPGTFIFLRSRAMSLTAARRRGCRAMKNIEIAPVEFEEMAEINGDHVGRAQSAAEQCHLAEKRPRLQPDRIARQADLGGTGRDEIHRIAPLADPDDLVAGRGRGWTE